MWQQSSSLLSEQRPPNALPAKGAVSGRLLEHRVLFLSSSGLRHVSGTPVILDELLCQFADGHAELLCEARPNETRTRNVLSRHPTYTFSFQNTLWPFRRGSRFRSVIALAGFPWLLAIGLWRVAVFRPNCIIGIYYDTRWILAAYLISKLSSIPLIYYVHDAFAENVGGTFSIRRNWLAWIERITLRSARVLVLHSSLAARYHRRHAIRCTVIRRIITKVPLGRGRRFPGHEERVIGFAGAIYDNNARELAEICQIVRDEPRLSLRLFTGTSPEQLAKLGIGGERVAISFEQDYDKLLALLANCDLLYLPLSFSDTESLSTDALQFAFPTKGIDYLLTGQPILIHCPPAFELFQFFQTARCAYLLGTNEPEALRVWLKEWLEGKQLPLAEENRSSALNLFSAEHNMYNLSTVLDEVAIRKDA